jgi:hypothetical protein
LSLAPVSEFIYVPDFFRLVCLIGNFFFYWKNGK